MDNTSAYMGKSFIKYIIVGNSNERRGSFKVTDYNAQIKNNNKTYEFVHDKQ